MIYIGQLSEIIKIQKIHQIRGTCCPTCMSVTMELPMKQYFIKVIFTKDYNTRVVTFAYWHYDYCHCVLSWWGAYVWVAF